MREGEALRDIQAAASAAGHRLFRVNVGKAWVGKVVSRSDKHVTLENPRPFHAGMIEGQSDLIGWTRDGTFAAIEVKAGRTATTEAQRRFVDAVIAAGGRAGIVRSVDEAMAILDG